jgi:hypothetical protein
MVWHFYVKTKTAIISSKNQRFDFERNLEMTRKLIIPTPPGLGLKPLA